MILSRFPGMYRKKKEGQDRRSGIADNGICSDGQVVLDLAFRLVFSLSVFLVLGFQR